MPKHHEFKELIDNAFRKSIELDIAKSSDSNSRSEQAKFLSISPGHFSKLLSGNVHLSQKLALSFAEKLFKGNKTLINSIADKFLESTLSPAVLHDSFFTIDSFFQELEEKKPSLLTIEYRDKPQTPPSSGGKHQESAGLLGKAIAHGLHVALFQPFGSFTNREANECCSSIPEIITRYKIDISRLTLQAYKTIYSAAVNIMALERTLKKEFEELTRQNVEDADIEAELIKAKQEIKERICLYIATDNNNLGFCSRIFGANYIDSEKNLHHRDVWEWVSADNYLLKQKNFDSLDINDFFIPRNRDNLTYEVFAGQFHPITTMWEITRSLPSSKEELEQCYEKANELKDDESCWWYGADLKKDKLWEYKVPVYSKSEGYWATILNAKK